MHWAAQWNTTRVWRLVTRHGLHSRPRKVSISNWQVAEAMHDHFRNEGHDHVACLRITCGSFRQPPCRTDTRRWVLFVVVCCASNTSTLSEDKGDKGNEKDVVRRTMPREVEVVGLLNDSTYGSRTIRPSRSQTGDVPRLKEKSVEIAESYTRMFFIGSSMATD